MNETHINEMIHALKNVLNDKAEAKEILQQYWSTRMALVWEILDVHMASNERKRVLTNAEAIEVLQEVFKKHDYTGGVLWRDFWEYIDAKSPGRPITPEELNRFKTQGIIAIEK